MRERPEGDVKKGGEYGPGAAFPATSKSGTNRLHGSGVEYYTAGGLRARNPFSGPNVGVTHQFATSLGGPIKKDKAFFFAAYSGNRSSSPSNQTQTVPTAAMRSGDFSAFSN